MEILIVEKDKITTEEWEQFDIDVCRDWMLTDEFTSNVEAHDFETQVSYTITDKLLSRVVHFIMRKETSELSKMRHISELITS